MNENLDLTKILEGCPVGTEFYHTGYGKVWLVCIDLVSEYPIRLSLRNEPFANIVLTKKGTLSKHYDGECLLLPSKEQRDWSKFERFWDKPKKERFNPKTLQPFDRVLVRGYNSNEWRASLYSHPTTSLGDGWFVCGNAYWHYLIPYNNDTKHLIGTKEDCPEYYKWWEE